MLVINSMYISLSDELLSSFLNLGKLIPGQRKKMLTCSSLHEISTLTTCAKSRKKPQAFNTQKFKTDAKSETKCLQNTTYNTNRMQQNVL